MAGPVETIVGENVSFDVEGLAHWSPGALADELRAYAEAEGHTFAHVLKKAHAEIRRLTFEFYDESLNEAAGFPRDYIG